MTTLITAAKETSKHGVQAGSTDTFCRKLQGAHQDSSIKKYVKYKLSASIVISWGLSSSTRIFH